MRAFIGNYDAIVCPVAAGPAPAHGRPPADIPVAEYFRYEGFNYTHVHSLAGLPVVAVPVSADPDGMPIGVQVVAAPFCEHVALAVAGVLEAEPPSFEARLRGIDQRAGVS
jgi:amidase